MSENPGQPSSEELLGKIKAYLANLDERAKLPQIDPKTEVTQYISYNQNELSKLAPEDLNSAAFLIRQYSFYIQGLQNKALATYKYLDEFLRQWVMTYVDQYNGYSLEERRRKAVSGNEYSGKLHVAMLKAQLEIDNFQYTATSLSKMADSMDKLADTKRGRYVSRWVVKTSIHT